MADEYAVDPRLLNTEGYRAYVRSRAEDDGQVRYSIYGAAVAGGEARKKRVALRFHALRGDARAAARLARAEELAIAVARYLSLDGDAEEATDILAAFVRLPKLDFGLLTYLATKDEGDRIAHAWHDGADGMIVVSHEGDPYPPQKFDPSHFKAWLAAQEVIDETTRLIEGRPQGEAVQPL